MSKLWRFFRIAAKKEPVAFIALALSLLTLLIQSELLYDKVRPKLTVVSYHEEWLGLHGCRLQQFTIDNPTNKIIGRIKIIFHVDWVTRREGTDYYLLDLTRPALLGLYSLKFRERALSGVEYQMSQNVLSVKELKPGEWLDLAVGYELVESSESLRKGNAQHESNYFMPRIAEAFSEDGKALVRHHPDSCLGNEYRPGNETWRNWLFWWIGLPKNVIVNSVPVAPSLVDPAYP